MSTPDETTSTAQANQQKLVREGAERLLAQLSRALEDLTGKPVKKIVVHYEDGTVRSVRSESREDRIAAKRARNEARRQEMATEA